jgi:hypothetical protein
MRPAEPLIIPGHGSWPFQFLFFFASHRPILRPLFRPLLAPLVVGLRCHTPYLDAENGQQTAHAHRSLGSIDDPPLEVQGS